MLVPCYNEEANIWPLTEAIESSLQHPKLQARIGRNFDYKIVFVDNCSRDNTWQRISQLAEQNHHVNGIRHAVNYGQLLSPYMALCQSEADFTVLISADFEDPPALIPELILAQLDSGAAVIAAVRREDRESAWRRTSRRFGYFMMGKISDAHSITGFHGFGLYSAGAVKAFRSYHEIRPYIRLIPSYLGLSVHCVPHARDQRIHGESSNNIATLFELAVDGIIQFSAFPAQLITSVAVLQWFLTVVVSLVLLAVEINSGLSAQFLILLLTYIGVSFLVLAVGIAVQYLYRIYAMQTGRPYYRIDSLCGDLKQLSLAK